MPGGSKFCRLATGAVRSNSRTESTHEIDDQADHQQQSNPAAANHGAAKVKPAATEHKEQNKDEQ